jgi:hypothetical protein
MTTFDLWPRPLGGGAWGAGTNMWHPETPASYESLPAPLATQISTLWIHSSRGRGRGGGSNIRSMSSIRPIIKCRCPPLQIRLGSCQVTEQSVPPWSFQKLPCLLVVIFLHLSNNAVFLPFSISICQSYCRTFKFILHLAATLSGCPSSSVRRPNPLAFRIILHLSTNWQDVCLILNFASSVKQIVLLLILFFICQPIVHLLVFFSISQPKLLAIRLLLLLSINYPPDSLLFLLSTKPLALRLLLHLSFNCPPVSLLLHLSTKPLNYPSFASSVN